MEIPQSKTKETNMPKIKLDKELYKEVRQYAEDSGYSSAEEFVVHLLEQVIGASDGDDDGDVMERLKGLGYIS